MFFDTMLAETESAQVHSESYSKKIKSIVQDWMSLALVGLFKKKKQFLFGIV